MTTQEIEVQGRKIPLNKIRLDLNKKQEMYMRIHNDQELLALSRDDLIKNFKRINEFRHDFETLTTEELRQKLCVFERSRHLMLWHDGSTVSNHSHLLMMVSTMYDPAIYLTNEEFFAKHKYYINIQSIIERSNLYILVRCPSNDQQIMYSETTLEDILTLNNPLPTPSGIPLNDVVWVFKGHAPAAQFEAGQQKGGNYFCWSCPMKSNQSQDIISTFNAPFLSLEDRITKVKQSVASQDKLDNQRMKLYSNLDKAQLINELHQRKIKFDPKQNNKDLQFKLQNEMHGIQRLPALMFNEPSSSLLQLNLNKYEILNNEPLHDISNHIKNLFHDLPWQFENPFKENFQSIISSSFNDKDAKN